MYVVSLPERADGLVGEGTSGHSFFFVSLWLFHGGCIGCIGCIVAVLSVVCCLCGTACRLKCCLRLHMSKKDGVLADTDTVVTVLDT